VLRPVRDLEKLRVVASDGVACGRVKDIYFDDHAWTIKHVVLGLEPRRFARKQVLLRPDQIQFNGIAALLKVSSVQILALPLASSVLPVCRQYASMALGSPRANDLVQSDPYLRSARAVAQYQLNESGEFAGTLSDFLFDDESWEIRFLAIEQVIEQKKLRFHVLPQSVERFTWATQRVLLRNLQPVELAAEQHVWAVAA
jgi:sporulation protein YlmC with PRC-barrel domain